MRSKRVLKLIICLIVSVSIIFQCSFSCFAAKEYYSCDSGDWVIDSNKVFEGHYPDKNPPIASDFSPEVYLHKELYDDYYFISKQWNDDYERVTDVQFFMPDFPKESFFPSNCSSLIFSYNDLYFLITGFDCSKLHVVGYSNTFYLFSVSGIQSAYIYSLTYPYDSWSYYGSVSVLQNGLNYPLSDFDGSSVVWSDCPLYDIYDPEFYITSPASDFDIFSQLFSLTLTRTLSVTEGLLFLELNKPITQKLSFKDVSFLFDRFGYIIGTDSSFVHFDVDMTIYINNELIGTADVFDYCFDGSFSDAILSSGQGYISSYDCRMDFSETDIGDNNLYIFISFNFASDGYNLIFPGDFSIVSASELEAEKNHKTIINSVNNASSQISSSIDAVNSSINYIISGDVDVEQPDLDTSELDDIVSEQDEIIGDILSSLNDDISDFVPAGYSSYTDYLIDNINSFKSSEYENTFTFIRSTFDSLIANLSILPLLLFSLTFGFGVFALGRRLS